ncbi:MAG: DUF1839 family protein [Pseudomonadales bacterium]|nr:DUF1839 family protein [Pseudomonadales bacterium]MCP5185800.1 DUF1839 family protein [Pseudomonadales bacterium]
MTPAESLPESRHALHRGGRIWDESNCYLDVVIELLHYLGHEPLAALGITVSTRWEADQWTFCKFNDEDLRRLFGVDIQELNPWDRLLDHVQAQVEVGNTALVEVDSWFLPDTHGSAYRRAHVKTTIGVLSLDTVRESMCYLHGAGRYQLNGEDFTGIWRLSAENDGGLPPYVELVRQMHTSRAPDIHEAAIHILKREIDRLPATNPLVDFTESFAARLPEFIRSGDMELFHRYAFATFRQIGACFELLGSHLIWLRDRCSALDGKIAENCNAIASTSRTFQFQLARALARRRMLDLKPLEDMASRWERVTKSLQEALPVC